VAAPEIAMRAVEEGAQDYLVKTEINGRVLSRAIRYAVERNALRAELRHYTTELEERNQAIEAELNLARSIQEAYLPATRVTFPSNSRGDTESLRFTCRFQPAANLSGDIDLFPGMLTGWGLATMITPDLWQMSRRRVSEDVRLSEGRPRGGTVPGFSVQSRRLTDV